MNNDHSADKIEAWLSGKLSLEAARALEAAAAADPVLAARVAQHRLARLAIERLQEQDLQQDFARWRETLEDLPSPPDAFPVDETPLKSKPSLRGLWVVLPFLLAVVGVVVWYFSARQISRPLVEPAPNAVPPAPTTQKPIAGMPVEKPGEPQNPATPPPASPKRPDLLALAEQNLKHYKRDVLKQYGQTMGGQNSENPFFEAGLKAFKSRDALMAKQNLLKIPLSDDYFASAQEILAWLYFNESNFVEAATCYEAFASQGATPMTDWYMLQFYLADYGHRKRDFWKKIDNITDAKAGHPYRKSAKRLAAKLRAAGMAK